MSGRLVLVRHGQSHGNVDRRLDTRPPGAELTDLGSRAGARIRAQTGAAAPVCLRTPSRCGRDRPPPRSATHLGAAAHEFEGIHEVQVGDLENRNDDEAVDEFNAIYQRWHEGDLDVPMPGGETALEVLDRYVPVLTDLRLRYLDDHAWTGDIVVVSHGAAIRLVPDLLPGSTAASPWNTIWPTPNPWCSPRSPTAGGAACTGALTPPFYPEPSAPGEDALQAPTRWADASDRHAATDRAGAADRVAVDRRTRAEPRGWGSRARCTPSAAADGG